MKIQATEIREIAHLLVSDDYKQRFVGEYWELRIRLEKLNDMIRKYDLGVLGFKLDCPIQKLREQANIMWDYLNILEDRAIYEKIDLTLNYTPPQKEPEVVEAEQVKEVPRKKPVKKS